MIGNILKIVFLGIIGFAGLVYLTAPEDKLKPKAKVDEAKLNIAYLPSHYEFINDSFYTKKQDLFKKGESSYIVVANHDSLVVVNELHKYTDKKVILVANISRTPWLIKKLAVDGKLEELYKTSKIKIVNDSNGEIVKALGLNDIIPNKYFVYKVLEDGNIKKLSTGTVKLDAMQKGISKEEIKASNESIAKALN